MMALEFIGACVVIVIFIAGAFWVIDNIKVKK